jgi:hypothetical protein
MTMPATPLIVLERDGHWAVALHAELAAMPVRVAEVRSWDECRQILTEWPTALIAAELTEKDAGPLLDALGRLDRNFPHAALVVLAERRLAGYGDLMREAGGLHFITSPRRLVEIAEIVVRRSAKFQGPFAATSRTDEILADLPWPEAVE